MTFYVYEDYPVRYRRNIFIDHPTSPPTTLYRYSFPDLSYFQQTVFVGDREGNNFKQSGKYEFENSSQRMLEPRRNLKGNLGYPSA